MLDILLDFSMIVKLHAKLVKTFISRNLKWFTIKPSSKSDLQQWQIIKLT